MSDDSTTADFGANDWFIEALRESWEQDPDSVDPVWAAYFRSGGRDVAEAPTTTTPPSAPAPKKAAPAPSTPAKAKPTAKPIPKPTPQPSGESDGSPALTVLKGTPMRTARNMEASLAVPTATSVRSVPMKLAIEVRRDINDHLKRNRGGKVSFTHLVAWAMVRAVHDIPAMNNHYEEIDGKPHLVEPAAINLGVAIDVKKSDGSRNLVVPSVKDAGRLDFAGFLAAYEDVVARSRDNKLTLDDFAGTTCTITNPGGIGTNHSIPRLMDGQAFILGVGAIDYPAEVHGASQEWRDERAISKITTLTSTYDHRVIQGAQSGEFLNRMHQMLLGQHNFYDDIFASLRIPYSPLRWAQDEIILHEDQITKQARLLAMIDAYRNFGHLGADIDPLGEPREAANDLALEASDLTLWDLDRRYAIGDFGGKGKTSFTVREVRDILRDAYCRAVAVEYMHLTKREERLWFQERLEQPFDPMPHSEQMRVLDRLSEAEVFETFLQTKYVGQKRFSLEGGESTIVALDTICDDAADAGLAEVCIGMPHRGRLNVLANIIGKSYGQIFREFDEEVEASGTGDVKYHLGAEGEFTAASGARVLTSVAANPSHLEAVNPVLEGIVRAKQDLRGRRNTEVLPVLLHGDASFAGQGINLETLQMSQLEAYHTGGTIHVVVNNQIGFTTAPSDARTSRYCTDVAKAIEAPVFHVNGDKPEDVARVSHLALEYRQRFHKDVVIDIVCYRRRGHNEGDDPSFTQPAMYDRIEAKRSVRKLYTDSLIGRGDLSGEEAEEVAQKFRERLESVFKEARSDSAEVADYTRVPHYPDKRGRDTDTSIPREVVERIAKAHTAIPEGFTVHRKVKPQLERRREAMLNGPVDWASAEALAFGSLLIEGRPVRLAGQDSRRGTFSQRFGLVVDRETSRRWVPLRHLDDEQGDFFVYDSLLSEYGALGFEYGYSVARPETLVLWEAQYGDFVNGAQTISDEFVVSGNAKWGQKSGVVLLLPHGLDGSGPDHSSARLERWLTLCSEDALAVCQPSTPASYFHLLRTHAYVNWHRPVVVATPKSMLRSKYAVSEVEDFTHGRWHPAMSDPTVSDPGAITRVLLCSGKVRWDLTQRREQLGLEGTVAILPLERLYPLPTAELGRAMQGIGDKAEILWVQEEPSNQGAWPFMSRHLAAALSRELGREVHISAVTREEASAPAVGSHHVHTRQQEELLAIALGG